MPIDAAAGEIVRVDAALAQNLRQAGGVPEVVRAPVDGGRDPVFLVCIGHSIQDLPHNAFAGNQVVIVLDPGRRRHIPAAALDVPAHPGIGAGEAPAGDIIGRALALRKGKRRRFF